MVQGDTAQHLGFFGTRNHYWVNFLQVFCHSVNMLTFELNVLPYFTTPEIVWVVTSPCEFCNRTVEEPPVVIKESLISRVRFPRLKMTKINQHTMKVLKESLGLVNTRNYNLEGHDMNITPEQATLGLFNSFLDTTVRRQNALVDRYTQHPDNAEGRRVMTHFVPQNFSKYLDLRDTFSLETSVLSDCIIAAIFRMICVHVRLSRISCIDSTLLVMPSSTLPWYPLVEALYKAGKLPSLLKYMSDTADVQLMGIQFTPEQVAPHIGILAMKLIGFLSKDYPVVLLSNYRDIDIKRVILQHMTLIIWRYYFEQSPYFHGKDNSPESLELSLKTCSSVILLLLADLTNDKNDSVNIDDIDLGHRQISDIMVFDSDALTNKIEYLDSTNANDLLSPYLGIVSHVSKYPREKIVEHIAENVDAAISDAVAVFEELSVEITITTPLNCLETLKIHASEQPARHDRHYERATHIPLQEYFTVPTTIPRHNMVICPPYEENATYVPLPETPYFDRYDRRNISNQFLHRVLGNSNDTPNRLNYIFHYLKNPRYEGPTKGIHMSILGDGIGNGLSYLLSQFPQTHAVFTTRPEAKNLEVRPIVCEQFIESSLSQIYVDHAIEGIYDLSDEDVIQHLITRYGSQNLYFCDAEPGPNDQEKIFLVYKNIIHYFLSTRSEHSILIMQCTVEKASLYTQYMAILQQYCTNVINILPYTVRCVYSQYIVAWGVRLPYRCQTLRLPDQIPTGIYNMYTKIFANTVRAYEAQRASSDGLIRLNTKEFIFNFNAMVRITPLWASYCQRYLNKLIPNELICQIRNDMYSDEDKTQVMLKHAPRFEDFIQNYLAILSKPDHDPVMRIQRYGMDYREHRLAVVRTLMVAYGWESAFYYYTTRHESVSMKVVRGLFLNLCETLPRRDYTPEKKYIGVFSVTGMYDPDGAKLDYWNFFCRGFEFFLSYVAWCNATSLENLDARYYDG